MASLVVTLANDLYITTATAATWNVFVWGTDKWGGGNPGDQWYMGHAAYWSDDFPHTNTSGSIELLDGSGFKFVFRAPDTNEFNRLVPSFTSGTQTTTSWTSVALAGGNWV